jgi:hypothetical protein
VALHRFDIQTINRRLRANFFICPTNSLTEMSGDSLMFEEFIALCDEQYEYGLIEFKNGEVINKPGENDGTAKVLSYAALAGFDKDMTLKVSRMVILWQFVRRETIFSSYILPGTIALIQLWGQYYRDVIATPDGNDHPNIRNFLKVSRCPLEFRDRRVLSLTVRENCTFLCCLQYGWDGVDFSNGIALTKKAVGDNNWDWDSESWIP